MTFENVVQCTVYLPDVNDYATVNEVYARYFSAAPPARAAVPLTGLPGRARRGLSCSAAEAEYAAPGSAAERRLRSAVNASVDAVRRMYLAIVSVGGAGSVIDPTPSAVTAKSITARKM